MSGGQILWDLEDDPDGNVWHIREGHDVTLDEVEDVLLNTRNETTTSNSSGESVTFGWTSTGRYIAVVWQKVCDNPRIIRPITAYPVPVPRPRGRGHGKGKKR